MSASRETLIRALRLAAPALAIAVLAVVAACLWQGWQQFETICTSRDVLQPDGNVRMVEALDRYQDFRDGRGWRAAASYFVYGDTWPPMRSTIALALFGLFQPSTEIDAAISLFFYGLLFVALLAIALRHAPDRFSGVAAFAFGAMMLLSTFEFPAYAMASMLETQGMFFLALAYAAFLGLYTSGGAISTRLKILLAVSLIGLGATKYPYAIMLFLAALLLEFLRQPTAFVEFAATLLRQRYRGLRLALLILAALAVGAILVAGKLGYTGINNKAPRYLIWLIAVVLFIDLNLGFWVRRDLLQSAPASLRAIYLFGVAPVFGWILLHPDRFSSIIGGQFWQPPPGIDPALLFRSSFFETLFAHVFQHGAFFVALLILAALGLFALIGHRSGGVSAPPPAATELHSLTPPKVWPAVRRLLSGLEGLAGMLREPLVLGFLLIWLQFLAQELFSPNKQDRHIYHFLPAMLISASLLALRIDHAFPGHAMRQFIRSGAPLVLLGMALVGALLPGGALRADWVDPSRREFCFTGREPELFEPARWAAAQVESGKRYILINKMHGAPIRPEQREQGTEIDLLTRLAAIKGGGALRTDSRFVWSSWDEFDRLLVVSPVCDGEIVNQMVQARAAELEDGLQPGKQQAHPGGRFCLFEYELQP